ncbi:C40 family peptidase [Corynebacterium striatum]|uniref:C40 family peptidase n=1 Tax=Corynebacterium striatum TaxID=43770 RepID=UPI003B63240C
MIEAAVKQISQMAPPALPAVGLPQLPDLSTIDAAVAKARTLIQATGQDLIGIGLQLLTQAAPLALGLLVPNPAVQAAARARLHGLTTEHLASAFARVKQLLAELVAVAKPLLPIAQRAIEPTVKGRAEGTGNELSPSKTPEPHAISAKHSTAISGDESSGSAQGRAAVAAAMSKLGTPYVWGGTGNGGFDCSGLTQWAWRQAGVEIPRTAESQTVGRQVSADELQPGDLVVWDGHVAMYKGGGEMIEAGSPVETSPLRTTNMGMAFKGFWRPTG